MHDNPPSWQTSVVDGNLSTNSPNVYELRKRSFPGSMNESQHKEAIAMARELSASPPPYEEAQSQAPTFFKKHFYRLTKTGESRFSFLSRGFLVSLATGSLIIAAILIAVVVTLYERHERHEESLKSPARLAIDGNFADPSILYHDGTWYAFATNNAAGILDQTANSSAISGVSNIQLATSDNFKDWTVQPASDDPLPHLGTWANQAVTSTGSSIANVWAPAILQRPSDGKFVLYYSAISNSANNSHCVGAAISETSSPAGPYTPYNTTIACPISAGGAIDPAVFVDSDDSIYVAWKVDGNNIGHGGPCGNTVAPQVPTPIMLQKMEADGVTPAAPATTILDRTDDDGPLVEAPALARSSDGIYFLFFSSGCTRYPSYDVKYAWAENVTGPYTRAEYPLLATDDWGLRAPGSVGIASDSSGNYEMAFHARKTESYGQVRAMYTTKIAFKGKKVVLEH